LLINNILIEAIYFKFWKILILLNATGDISEKLKKAIKKYVFNITNKK
jgi:hypothetical protein